MRQIVKREDGSVQVGALEDEEDPQEQKAAENAGGIAVAITKGAENTVPKSADETGQQSMGIDVSKHQGNIDWAKVKASGVEFAMVRVEYRAKSTGQLYEDPTAKYIICRKRRQQESGLGHISFPVR